MARVREVRRAITGTPTREGAGVHLVRVIGRGDDEAFDPFLLLDAFDSTDPAEYTMGFPYHPHRGMETVTYLIHGALEHRDHLGNVGRVTSGGCQWMTAGSGIIHQEMPEAAPRLLGVQTWINLPRAHKMAPPTYRDIPPDRIPEVRADGATIRVVAGRYGDVEGAVQGEYVQVQFLDVALAPGAGWETATDPEATLFAYIVEGEGRIGEASAQEVLGAHRAALTSPGEVFRARAEGEGLRLLLLAARPLGEPIAWAGPVVMNTREELRQAQAEIQSGTFGRRAPEA